MPVSEEKKNITKTSHSINNTKTPQKIAMYIKAILGKFQ